MHLQIISHLVERSLRTVRATATVTGLAIGVLSAVALPPGGPAHAQNVAKPGAEAAPQAVPGFWDPKRRPDRADLSRLSVIRVLTRNEYPPVHLNRPHRHSGRLHGDPAPQPF